MDNTKSYIPYFYYGDYKFRQVNANKDNVDIYIEYHFNSYSRQSNYSLCKIYNNPNTILQSSKFANIFLNKYEDAYGIVPYSNDNCYGKGIITLNLKDKDGFNISKLDCPAVILEPMFLSYDVHVNHLLSDNEILNMAYILVDTIKESFPDGAKIGLSVGHKYQRISPMDRGASVYNRSELTEADLADKILTMAYVILKRGL